MMAFAQVGTAAHQTEGRSGAVSGTFVDVMRIALFVTCYNDALFPEVGRAVIGLLRRLGHEVDFPADQTCCGQMHFNSGYQDACVPLVQRFTDAFAGYDAIVTPSGSCAAMVRHHHPLVAGLAERATPSSTLPERVAEVAPRVFELSEFLVDVIGVTDVGARFPHAVALHPTCHSVRLLGVGDRPRRLLEAVDGLRLVDLPRSEACCGFGGTFAVKNADTSVAMGNDKADDVVASGAEVLTAGDTSCLMHIGGLLSRRRSPVRVMHLAEILATTGARAS
jgi:L-lactate dehydrogenase complex protein LldE